MGCVHGGRIRDSGRCVGDAASRSANPLQPAAGHLNRGWYHNGVPFEARLEELELIEQDPDRLIARRVDRNTTGPPTTLPDGFLGAPAAGLPPTDLERRILR